MQQKYETNFTLLELYNQYIRHKVLSEATQKKYYDVITIFMKENPQVKYLYDINEDIVCNWRLKIINRSSNNNWNNYCRHLSALMKFAVNQELLPVNIFQNYKVKTINKNQIKTLSQGDIKKLLSYYKSENQFGWFWHAVTIILYKTGIRRRQLIGIKWRDIDLENKLLFLDGKYSKNGLSNYLPINDSIRDAIISIMRYTQDRPLNGQVFNITNFNGKYKDNVTTPEHITQHYRRVGTKLGITISPHRFRHTMATEVCRKGGNIRALQRVLNHRSITTTEVYMHAVIEDKQNVMALL